MSEYRNEDGGQHDLRSGSDQDASIKTITTAVYVLQAVSFLFGVTFIVAVVINYVKKEDVKGTWFESHFRWQIRTFWYWLLWLVVGLLSSVVGVGWIILFASFVWTIYRVVKGWLRLSEGKEMYV